jgi:hypothetical protein
LLIETAKASIDIPKARRIIAERVIACPDRGNIHMTHHCPQ